MIPKLLERKFEDFSKLPDEECALIISDYFLEALENDMYFEWEIITKFITIPFEIRDPLCKIFNAALKKNSQKIGNLTVAEWLERYLDKYAFRERQLDTFFEFSKNDVEVKKLQPDDRIILMRILRIYDYLFVIPIFNLDQIQVVNMLKISLQTEADFEKNNTQVEMTLPQKVILKECTLLEAMGIYKNLGEQLISSQKITLKGFPEPVRPSIKNWISDYTFNTGFENHNSFVRGNYLFKSENAHALDAEEKEKLSYILKAYDENLPVSINESIQQIVFPRAGIENRSPEIANSERNLNAGNMNFKPNSKVSFSYPQKMPFEKKNPMSPVSTRQIETRKPALPIVEERKLPKNVVDLRDNK